MDNRPDHRVTGMLHLVSEPSLAVTWVWADQGRGHVAHHNTWVGTERMDVSKRGSSWTVVDRQGRRSSKGVSVWHPHLGLNNRILISTRYIFFYVSLSKKNSRLNRAWPIQAWPRGDQGVTHCARHLSVTNIYFWKFVCSTCFLNDSSWAANFAPKD
jgi:hypothetical protein